MWHRYVSVCSKNLLSTARSFFPSLFPLNPSNLSLFSFFFTSLLLSHVSTSSPFHLHTQLHQLRRHTSVTAIMPSEGTTDAGEGDWTGEKGAWLGAGPSERRRHRSKACWLENRREKGRAPNGIQAWDILYCSASNHRGLGPHKQPVSVPAFPLLTAHWSYHELTCLKKKKKEEKKRVWKRWHATGRCGGQSHY